MDIHQAEFVKSSTGMEDLPAPDLNEYAFVGRSNVGKSSLINLLTGRTHLAKVSGTPGKTQLINHFRINDSWYLVDLPGYGYAKVDKKSRSGFSRMIEEYVMYRPTLINLFLLIDCRHEPQASDQAFIRKLGEAEVPFSLVFTKIDKLSNLQLNRQVAEYRRVLLKEWSELPPVFLTSSPGRKGRDEILEYIAEINRNLIDEMPVRP